METNFDYQLLRKLVEEVPDDLDKSLYKERISKKVREEVYERDNYSCRLCGYKEEVNCKLTIHHIIPNGEATPDNLITLCKYCHCTIHQLLYVTGKWNYIPMR